MGLRESLKIHVMDHVDAGCYEVGNSLGIRKMTEGYALMLVSDCTYYYWLRHDGVESSIHWDKWAVYRGAVKDSSCL